MILVRKLDVMLFLVSYENDQDRAVSAHKKLNNRLETLQRARTYKDEGRMITRDSHKSESTRYRAGASSQVICILIFYLKIYSVESAINTQSGTW